MVSEFSEFLLLYLKYIYCKFMYDVDKKKKKNVWCRYIFMCIGILYKNFDLKYGYWVVEKRIVYVYI